MLFEQPRYRVSTPTLGVAFETVNVSSATMTLAPTVNVTAAAAEFLAQSLELLPPQQLILLVLKQLVAVAQGTITPVLGSITVNPSAQAILKSPSSSQIVCDNSALVDIEYDIIGSTSIQLFQVVIIHLG